MDQFSFKYFKAKAIIIVIALMAIALYFARTHWGISISIITIISGSLVFINSYLWKVKPFCWLYNVPNFSGRYEGTLSYEFRNERNELVKDTLEHIKVISQNGSEIIINSWTKKKDDTYSSKSTSIEANIVKEKDNSYTLVYNYLNDGNSELNFSPHYGTEVIKFIKNGDDKYLNGKYYTERLPYQTKGKISVKFKNRDLTHLN